MRTGKDFLNFPHEAELSGGQAVEWFKESFFPYEFDLHERGGISIKVGAAKTDCPQR